MAAFRLLKTVNRKFLLSSSLRPFLCRGRQVETKYLKSKVRYGKTVKATSRPVAEEKDEWPDDGLGLGSYPKLPDISAQTKPPNGWWDMQERRNYGDTLHEEDDALNVWMYDAPEKSLYPPHEALRHLMTMFALLGTFMFIGYLYGNTERGNRNDYVPKEFPYNDNHIIYKNGDPKQRLKIN